MNLKLGLRVIAPLSHLERFSFARNIWLNHYTAVSCAEMCALESHLLIILSSRFCIISSSGSCKHSFKWVLCSRNSVSFICCVSGRRKVNTGLTCQTWESFNPANSNHISPKYNGWNLWLWLSGAVAKTSRRTGLIHTLIVLDGWSSLKQIYTFKLRGVVKERTSLRPVCYGPGEEILGITAVGRHVHLETG